MWRRVYLVCTDGSVERIVSKFRLPTKRRITHDQHGATSQKAAFFIVTAVKTKNLTYYVTCSTMVCMCTRKLQQRDLRVFLSLDNSDMKSRISVNSVRCSITETALKTIARWLHSPSQCQLFNDSVFSKWLSKSISFHITPHFSPPNGDGHLTNNKRFYNTYSKLHFCEFWIPI
jgi:hypothetical protein